MLWWRGCDVEVSGASVWCSCEKRVEGTSQPPKAMNTFWLAAMPDRDDEEGNDDASRVLLTSSHDDSLAVVVRMMLLMIILMERGRRG